jgi:anti-sigma factor RsiW
MALDELVAYARGELAAADEDRVEEHLFACEACARTLEDVQRLGAGIAALARAGHVGASTTGALVSRAEREGLRLRTYRLAPGEELPCTASPDDDYLVVRLAAAGALGEERVDVVREGVEVASGARHAWVDEDVVVDRAGDEVVLVFPAAAIRALPRSRWRFDLHARGPGPSRLVGTYALDHTPWQELPPDRRR